MRLQIQVAAISIFTLKQKSNLSIGVRIGITTHTTQVTQIALQNIGIKISHIKRARRAVKSSPLSMANKKA